MKYTINALSAVAILAGSSTAASVRHRGLSFSMPTDAVEALDVDALAGELEPEEMRKPGSNSSKKSKCGPGEFSGTYTYLSPGGMPYTATFVYNKFDEVQKGNFYLFQNGMSGVNSFVNDTIIQAGAYDNGLGDFTEDNFEKEEGKNGLCTFDLGVDLTCPLVDREGAENCTYTVKAVKLDSNTIELEFPPYGKRLAVKN